MIGIIIMNKDTLKRLLKKNRSELSMLLVFVAFYIVMSFASPSFNTKGNILNVLSQMSVMAILAIGQTFVIVSGGIDLSVGSVVAMSGMIGGMFMAQTQNFVAGVLIVIAVAVIAGAIDGVLVGYLKLPAFIATLGMQVIASSITYVYSDGNSCSGFPAILSALGNGKIFGIRYYIIFMIALYVICGLIMSNLKVGRFTYAIGSNAEATRLSGINVKFYTMMCYVISGLMCGFATLVNMARLLAVDPTTGSGLEMDAIAAVVIGGTSMAGGKGTLFGTFIGVLLYSFLRNALNLLGINPFWQGTATGVVIIVAVLAETLTSKRNK